MVIRVVLLLGLLLSAVACDRRPSSAVEPAERELVLQIEGMTCESCERAISHEVSGLKGVKQVRVSHRAKRGWVVLQGGEATPATIIKAIEGLGYKAAVLRPEGR